MATQLEVYNLALSHIKETKLAAVDEAREARYVLDDWWSQTRAYMLEAGFWKFAMRTLEITANTGITPTLGPSNAHDKPSDWVRTYLISASEFLDPPLEDWLEEGGYIFADATPIFMRYISNGASYGFDTTKWTARFVQAFSHRLAYNIAPKVTGASENSLKMLEDKADSSLAIALSFEALREPNKRPPEGRWNQARNGQRGGRADYWRYAR